MVAHNNPAGRLHGILTEALPLQANKPARQAWAKVFKIDVSATGKLLYDLAELTELLRLSRERIEQIEGIDHDLHLQPIEKLEDAFATMNVNAAWNDFKAHLDDATMVGLAFCANTLSQHYKEGEIEGEALESLLDEAEALRKIVLESDLDERLRAVLVENIESFRHAILQYRIRGAEGLLRAVELSIGALVRWRDEFKQRGECEAVRGFWTFLLKIDRIAGTALKVKQLLGGVANYLLGNEVSE